MSSLTSEHKLIFGLLCLGSLTISFNTAAVAASIPMISVSLGLSDFTVSKIVAFYMVPYGLGALLYAYLTRIFSYRQIFIAAFLLYAAMNMLSAVADSLNILLVSQVFAGMAAACSTPLSLMVIGDFFDKNVRGRLIGGFFGASFFASIIGMIFMTSVHWRWLFWIPSLLAIITALLLVILKVDLLNAKHEEEVNYLRVFSQSNIRNIFGFIFVMSFLYHAVHKWYGTFLHQQYGLDNQAIGLFLIFSATCGLFGQQIGGYFSDKRGRRFAACLGLTVLSVATIMLGLCFPKWIVPIVLGTISMGWTINHNSISAILTDFPDSDRPMVASLNSSVRFISGGLGFSLSRLFVEKSFSATFLTIGLLFLVLNFILIKVVKA